MYAKVAYFISVTVQHRCRKYNNLQKNQKHCKLDYWMKEVNIYSTVGVGGCVWISLTGAEFRNSLWMASQRVSEEGKMLRKQ